MITKDKSEIIEGAEKEFIDQNIFKSLNIGMSKRNFENKEGEDLSI